MLVLGGTLGLMGWAWTGARRAETARHREVAQRIFDAMEAELSDLVSREEARSFLEYRAYYLPTQNAKLGSVARSPLAAGGGNPLVEGYFQVDADGTVTSPEALRDNELALAQQEGWAPPVAAEGKLRALQELVAGVDWSRGEKMVLPSPAPGPSSMERLNSLGSLDRRNRAQQSQKASQANLDVYAGSDVPLQQTIDLGSLSHDTDELDVSVSPFQGVRRGEQLVMARQVRYEGRRTQQGFVIDVAKLATHLDERVVLATGLQEQVNLSWTAAAPHGRWQFDHRFAPPFEDLSVTVGIDPIPGVRGWEQGLLQWLSVMLLGLLALVGAALVWAVRSELVYAQRRQDFVAAVSHELKTPLTSIRMYAEMLRDGMVVDPARQHTYHATITSEAERLSRLIDNVLELSRMEQGAVRPAPVVGELGPVVQEAVAMLAPHARSQGARIEVTVAADLPAVSIDRDGLLQVLVNLIDNAVKFGGDGVVDIVVEAHGGGAAVRVRDGGPGVPPAQLRQIFDPFFRGERELTRSTKGTGIGLALVAGLVQAMGGTVVAVNRPEGGFEVSVCLVAPGQR